MPASENPFPFALAASVIDPIMSFTVSIQPSGRSFSMQRDETVLSAALGAGVGLPYGCKDGACGSCKCKLLEGRVITAPTRSRP